MTEFLRRSAAAVAAVAVSALLLTGCAGRADVASSSSPPLPRPTSSATAVATPTPPVTPSATPAPVPQTPTAIPTGDPLPAPEPSTERCTGADLSLEYRADPDASGAGSSAFDLIVTNTTDRACTLAGIPGVYAAGPDGVRLGAVASASGPNPSGLIALVPAAQADVRVAWHSPGAFGCPTATSSFLVAEVVDAADGAVRAPASIDVCTDGTVYLDASAYTLLG